jgi:3-oxoacyl-[acyl-carrier-protein] synthase-3
MAYFTLPGVEIVGLLTAIPTQGKAVVEQTASDLAYEATVNLIEKRVLNIDEIGFVIFLTRTPDYRTPCTAAVLQGRLGLSQDCIAYDINVGNLGFITGLHVGVSLLNAINKDYGLLLLGDTVSKQLPENGKLAPWYNDAASAILLKKENSVHAMHIEIKTYNTGIDLFKMTGAFRSEKKSYVTAKEIEKGELIFDEDVYYSHFISKISQEVNLFIKKCHTVIADYDCYIIHEENGKFLPEIKQRLNLDNEKVLSGFARNGNTLGASIPLSLTEKYKSNPPGEIRILACSYGEGFSMGIVDFCLNSACVFPSIQTDSFFDDIKTVHEI